MKTFTALLTVQFVGTDNAPCWSEPYLAFRKEMLDLHKDQLVALLDQECTSLVKVLLFSLHSRAYCEFPAHAPLAVTYMSVLDALALVDPTTSEPIHDETLAYVCGCAALVFRDVRRAVVEARVWFDTLSSKDKTSVRKASDSNLCAWFWTDEFNLVGRVPALFEFATFVFCVNVTSGCVESSFSVAKWVKSKTRTRLANYKVFNYLHIKDLGRIQHHCAFPTERTLKLMDF
jgi:hypothetical protein